MMIPFWKKIWYASSPRERTKFKLPDKTESQILSSIASSSLDNTRKT